VPSTKEKPRLPFREVRDPLAREPRATTQRHARESSLPPFEAPPHPPARLHHEGHSRRRPSPRSQPPAPVGRRPRRFGGPGDGHEAHQDARGVLHREGQGRRAHGPAQAQHALARHVPVLGRRHELRGRARPEREQGEEEPSRGERRGTSRRCVSTRERDGNHEALAEYFPS